MNKINWCLEQKKGIELVEPNDNLCKKYFDEAEQTLQLIENDDKWELIKAYYASYHALYALLMKAGVKCEIHDCTIELMKSIEAFDNEDYIFLSKLKDKRIQAQYYLKQVVLDNLLEVKKFIFKCQEISEELNIEELRGKIEK